MRLSHGWTENKRNIGRRPMSLRDGQPKGPLYGRERVRFSYIYYMYIEVYLEDAEPGLVVGHGDVDELVQTAGAHQGGVDDVGTVRRA
jgi:hypothetical protein